MEEVKQEQPQYIVKNLDEEVNRFLELTLPVNCGEIQREETAKAFKAGMFHGYALFQELVTNVTDEATLNQIHQIYADKLEEWRIQLTT